MKSLSILAFAFLSLFKTQAQIWDGSASTDWNTPANWNTNAVPLPAGNVTIPNVAALPNAPKLANDVIVNNLTANTGSKIDFNGFKLTINNDMNFNGCELNNSNPNTDIIINLNGITASTTYFRNNVVTDHITFNHNNADAFYEGYQGGNTYNFDFTFNAMAADPVYICYDNRSDFKGNVTLNRSIAGITEIFRVGNIGVEGNFSFTNNVGGATTIGQNGPNSATINGKINIECKPVSGSHNFKIFRTINLTAGGSIEAQNLGFTQLYDNSLIANDIKLLDFVSGSTSDVKSNTIVANLTFSESTSNTSATYFRGNIITGKTKIEHKTNNGFLEAYQLPNTYNGDFEMAISGTGIASICYDNRSDFKGNVTINRTLAGATEIFRTGNIGVTGNFSYTNNVGGATTIGQNGGNASTINGKINIECKPIAGNHSFKIFKTTNLTAGGNIHAENLGYTQLQDNSLIANNLNLLYFASGTISDVKSNVITANFNFTEGGSNSSGTYLRGNTVNGNTIINVNSPNAFYEGYLLANTFNGNFDMAIASASAVFICYDKPSKFNGDVTVTRFVTGPTNIFSVGTAGVTGNFSYTNIVSGNIKIGQLGGLQSVINGSVTLDVNHTIAGSTFEMYNVKNLVAGGFCLIQNHGYTQFADNDLTVNNLDFNKFASSTISDFKNNTIHGSTYIEEGATNAAGTYLRGNTFDGGFQYIQNTTQILYESYQYKNTYLNVARFRRNAGTIRLSYDNPSDFHGDLILNSASGISFTQPIYFKGVANTVIEQESSQVISISTLVMAKTIGSTLTLNDPVEINTTATFTTGKIISAVGKELKILDNSTVTGFSNNSFVVGPVIKEGNDIFTFPVGEGSTIAALSITAPATATTFVANYKHTSANPLYDLTLKAASLHHLTAMEYWTLDKTFGSGAVIVTIGWDAARSPGITNLTNLRLAHWASGQWIDEGNGGTTGDFMLGTIKSTAPISVFSPFTLASSDIQNPFIPAAPLPVTLINFSGKNTENGNELTWKTTNEKAFSRFEIERSSPLTPNTSASSVTRGNSIGKFEKIGEVKGSKGEIYEFIDNQNSSFITHNSSLFYRLRLVDQDGTYSYSKIIYIENEKNETITIYPNPSTDYFSVKNNSDFEQLQLIDLTGKTLRNFAKNNSNIYSLSGLEKGFYLVKIKTTKSLFQSKILIK